MQQQIQTHTHSGHRLHTCAAACRLARSAARRASFASRRARSASRCTSCEPHNRQSCCYGALLADT